MYERVKAVVSDIVQPQCELEREARPDSKLLVVDRLEVVAGLRCRYGHVVSPITLSIDARRREIRAL